MAILGIDLGTTNSLAAVWRNGRSELIPNAAGGYLTPSVVRVDEDGSIIPESTLTELVRYFDRAWNPVQEDGYYTLLCSAADETEAGGGTVFNVRVLDQAGEPLYSLPQTVVPGEVSP